MCWVFFILNSFVTLPRPFSSASFSCSIFFSLIKKYGVEIIKTRFLLGPDAVGNLLDVRHVVVHLTLHLLVHVGAGQDLTLKLLHIFYFRIDFVTIRSQLLNLPEEILHGPLDLVVDRNGEVIVLSSSGLHLLGEIPRHLGLLLSAEELTGG